MPAPTKLISSAAETLRAASVAQVGVDLLLGQPGREVERAREPQLLGDVGEQVVDRGDPDGLEHRRAVGVGGGRVPAHVRLWVYAGWSISASASDGSLSLMRTIQPAP